MGVNMTVELLRKQACVRLMGQHGTPLGANNWATSLGLYKKQTRTDVMNGQHIGNCGSTRFVSVPRDCDVQSAHSAFDFQ